MLIDDEDLDELRIDDSDSEDESLEGSSDDSECLTPRHVGPSVFEQKLPPFLTENHGLSEYVAAEPLH
jgi:hypothetical protein